MAEYLGVFNGLEDYGLEGYGLEGYDLERDHNPQDHILRVRVRVKSKCLSYEHPTSH